MTTINEMKIYITKYITTINKILNLKNNNKMKNTT